MQTSLEKLPERKREELELIVEMIREEFEVEMIILFGSHARGEWVEELGPDQFYYKYQKEYKEKAQKYYEYWFKSASSFFIDYKACVERNDLLKAAFELHQSTERYYFALLLVLTDYRPKTHDIKKLGKLAFGREPKLLEVFPQGTSEERGQFELPRKAYVDARYEESYSISKEDLEWLESRVIILKDLTERICKKRIESFTKQTVY